MNKILCYYEYRGETIQRRFTSPPQQGDCLELPNDRLGTINRVVHRWSSSYKHYETHLQVSELD